DVDLGAVCVDGDAGEAARLFGESAGRFMVEVAPDKYDEFLRIVRDRPFGEIGKVTAGGRVVIASEGRTVVDVAAADVKAAWQETFDW
ncbi:MAG: hypothetical protein ISS78_12595, partial [Phycisphaerae bacterium]|nr:hypothetical protein [Phycisphaerae bacterium]